MQPGDAQVRLEPRLEAAGFDDHARLIRGGHVRGARCEQPDLALDGLGRESLAQDASGRVIEGDFHAIAAPGLGQRGAMLGGQPADQALALLLGHDHGEPRRVGWRFAGRENHLRNATAQMPAEVELRPTAELVELDAAQLPDRLVLAQLAGDEPAQDLPHRPSRTSRIRCQCVPAQ